MAWNLKIVNNLECFSLWLFHYRNNRGWDWLKHVYPMDFFYA